MVLYIDSGEACFFTGAKCCFLGSCGLLYHEKHKEKRPQWISISMITGADPQIMGVFWGQTVKQKGIACCVEAVESIKEGRFETYSAKLWYFLAIEEYGTHWQIRGISWTAPLMWILSGHIVK